MKKIRQYSQQYRLNAHIPWKLKLPKLTQEKVENLKLHWLNKVYLKLWTSTKTTLGPNKLYHAFKQETTQTSLFFRDWKNKEHFWFISWDYRYFVSKSTDIAGKQSKTEKTPTLSHEHETLTVDSK